MEKKENNYTGVIYCLTNKVNGKQYIGQSSSYIINHGKLIRHGLEGRFKVHCEYAKSGKNSCPKLYPDIRQYGVDNFTKEILEIVPVELLDELETQYICEYDTINNGYNTRDHGVPRLSEEDNQLRIDKIKDTMIKNWKDPEYINKTIPANLQAVLYRADNGLTRTKNKDQRSPS